MNQPVQEGDAERAAKLPRYAGLVLLLVVVSGLVTLSGFHAAANADHLHGISRLYDRSGAFGLPPALVVQRQFAMDSYMWNVLASRAGNGEGDGYRHTRFDNAPEGRPVFWSPAYTWYLRVLGALRHSFVPNESFTASVFAASLWSNFLLLAVGLLVLGVLYCVRFGAVGACVLVVAMVLTPGFYEVFLPGYADHHAPLVLLLLGMFLGLLSGGLGFIGGEEADGAARQRGRARMAMVLSALCGAGAMAVSAISTKITLCAIGLGALAFFVAGRRVIVKASWEFAPGLWRTWGLVAACASLVFYAATYFPWAGAMRLEVNHPFYALAWWGGAELLGAAGCLLAGCGFQGRVSMTRLALAACAVSMPVLAILLFGGSVHAARDPFFAAITENIVEFRPLGERLAAGSLDWKTAFGPAPVLLLAAGYLFFCRRGLPVLERLILVFLVVSLCSIMAVQFWQTRWGLLAAPVMVLLAAWCAGLAAQLAIRSEKPLQVFAALFASCLLAMLAFGERSAFHEIVRYSDPRKAVVPTNQDVYTLMMRDIATTIRADAEGREATILANPSASLLLAAFAEGRTLGTLYWENTQGLRKAAEILCASSAEVAWPLLRQAGITHVVLIEGDNFLDEYRAALEAAGVQGLPETDKLWPQEALSRNILPAWAEQVDYPPNDFSRALRRKLLILRVK